VLATDQRGTPRAQDGNGDSVARCDIGAFEGTSGVITTTTTTSTTTTTYPFFPGDPLPGEVGSTTTTIAQPPTTTTTSTTTTTVPTTGAVASSTTTTSTTSSTKIGLAEICGNCTDDDGNGLVDFEDPVCCGDAPPQAFTLKKVKLRPLGTRTRLKLKGSVVSVTLGTFPPATKDVYLQLRPEAGGEALCAHIPAAKLIGKKKTLKFKDKTGTVTSAQGLKARIRKDGSIRVATKGEQVDFPTPAAGRIRATLAFRDPGTAEDGNQCRGITQPFRAVGKKGALKFP
jgi:hypothetical protein